MSRSKKNFPAACIAYGARSKLGKVNTSRQLRRKVRQTLSYEQENFDFTHPLDKNRGFWGTRDYDWGWSYFGDGRYNPHKLEERWGWEMVHKLFRK